MTYRDTHATLPSLVQRFFADWLVAQREASPHTVASYRDTFRLLLSYASRRLARQPTDLSVADIDADLVAGFLASVEDVRKNSIGTRNVRRAAIRAFFRFVAIREPALLLQCQRLATARNGMGDDRGAPGGTRLFQPRAGRHPGPGDRPGDRGRRLGQANRRRPVGRGFARVARRGGERVARRSTGRSARCFGRTGISDRGSAYVELHISCIVVREVLCGVAILLHFGSAA